MKLTSRNVTFDIHDITKINIHPDDVIIVRTDFQSMSHSKQNMYADRLKAVFKHAFPANEVIIMDAAVSITIATLNP